MNTFFFRAMTSQGVLVHVFPRYAAISISRTWHRFYTGCPSRSKHLSGLGSSTRTALACGLLRSPDMTTNTLPCVCVCKIE